MRKNLFILAVAAVIVGIFAFAGDGLIPPNAALIFVVELVGIK